MSRDDELADYPSVSLHQLAQKRWILFQRRSHPLLYDLIQKQAEELRIVPSGLQHFMVPEEAIPLMSDPGGAVIVGKSGAVRIARDGLTMRPLDEAALMTSTLLISRADNDSKAVSELVRSFMRRLNYLMVEEQLSLPLAHIASGRNIDHGVV